MAGTSEHRGRAHRRNLVRISLRGLIMLILIIAVGAGWIARRARTQREAVAAIRQAGGQVSYNWEWTAGAAVKPGKPPWPARLVRSLGVDYFGHVTRVTLDNGGGADALMAHIGQLPDLEDLSISGEAVTDAGMAHLAELTRLTSLTIYRTRITNRGLGRLQALAQLGRLSISDCNVSDAALVHLRGLTKLSWLELRQIGLTDAGLRELKGLVGLRQLSIQSRWVTPTGVTDFRKARPLVFVLSWSLP